MERRFRPWRWLAAALLALAALPLAWPRQAGRTVLPTVEPGEVWEIPGEIVVDLRDDVPESQIARMAGAYGVAFDGEPMEANRGRILEVRTTPALAPALLARLRRDPNVEAAEPQRLFRAYWKPNDPRYAEQWNFQRIHVEKAWDVTKGRGAVVAVIDTGVAFEKDEKCHLCRDFGQTRFTDPYDFIHRDKHPTDDHGHGTHVAGTIAESTDNGEGVAGIAFQAKVMPLKVLTREGWGRMSDIAAAIRYAADHGANVINMSLGGPRPDSITRSAVKHAYSKGVTIVCAAGNSGSEGVGYPAAYPECIAVSALGPTGELAFYSSWGREIALSAPGGDKQVGGEAGGILQNTYLRRHDRAGASGDPDGPGADDPGAWERLNGGDAVLQAGDQDSGPPNAGPAASSQQEDDYFSFQGTSMASPHVAGVAALVVSQGVKDPAEVRAVLQKSAQKRGPSSKYGAGEVDAAAAVRAARGLSLGHNGRLLLAAGLWAACLLLPGARRRGLRSPALAGALAATIGLFLPDVVTAVAGFDAAWNLLGHSILLPGYLLIAEAEAPSERRFLGLMAAGMAAHLLWDLWLGIAPGVGLLTATALPWLWANVVVGAGAFVAGLRR